MLDNFEPTISPNKIKGNASLESREFLSNPAHFFSRHPDSPAYPSAVFCESIHRRLVVTDISIECKKGDDKKKEAVVVVELDVTDGGCDWYSFIVDIKAFCRYDESGEYHGRRLYCVSC